MKDDIIRMAREAGWTGYDSQDERFERLVELARAAEREACAKLCEDKWATHDEADIFAAAIRARKNT